MGRLPAAEENLEFFDSNTKTTYKSLLLLGKVSGIGQNDIGNRMANKGSAISPRLPLVCLWDVSRKGDGVD